MTSYLQESLYSKSVTQSRDIYIYSNRQAHINTGNCRTNTRATLLKCGHRNLTVVSHQHFEEKTHHAKLVLLMLIYNPVS